MIKNAVHLKAVEEVLKFLRENNVQPRIQDLERYQPVGESISLNHSQSYVNTA